jgi:thioredoxin-dependent peroxiredoxin
MARTVTMHGNKLTLVGNEVRVGDKAPEFTATSQDMKDVKLTDFKDKIKVISSFPSLDTPVCDLQVKEFNKRSASFSSDIVVIGISKDLPFAIKRFCSEHDIKNVIVSDYKFGSFGMHYGLLIDEIKLLARAVLIVDKSDVIRYVQIVPELSTPPDYEAALKALTMVAR